MLHTAANSAQTPTFPKLWPAILPAAEVFKSMAGRLFLAKMPWNRKGIRKLTWDQMEKEINGQIRKSKQDTHHQNFLCLGGVYKAGSASVMTKEWYHDLFGYSYRQNHFVKSWQLPNSWLPESSVKYNPLPDPQIKSIPFNVISARSEELTAKELHIDYATSIPRKTTLKQHPESNIFLNSIKFCYQRLSIYFYYKVPYLQGIPSGFRSTRAFTGPYNKYTHTNISPHAHKHLFFHIGSLFNILCIA